MRVPPPSGRVGYAPQPMQKRPQARVSYAPQPAQKGALGIPGLQKGFGKSAEPARGLQIFKTGDVVMHSTFGRGEVIDVSESGGRSYVQVRFPGDVEKKFAADIAPLRKIN